MNEAAGWRIVYDGQCRFCRWSLGWVLRWDRARRLTPVELDDPLAVELLAGMDEGRRRASWHLVDPAGRVRSAGAAAPALARLLPAGGPLAALFDRIPRLVERVYRWVADHRGRFGPLIRPRALARADALIADRQVAPGDGGEGKLHR